MLIGSIKAVTGWCCVRFAQMKKRHLFSLSLLLFNSGFSEELEKNFLSSDLSNLITENRSDTSNLQEKKANPHSSQTQKELAEKQAQLDHKEKDLFDQEEALRAKEDQLSKQKQTLFDQMDEIKTQVEELSLREEGLAKRKEKDAKREQQLSERESLLSDQTVKDPTSTCSMFHTMHLGIRHTEARGVGYQTGYTTLEGFGISSHNSSLMPFFDIRGHVFNDGKFAGNVGIGGRSYLPTTHHLFGYYCYYDIRQDRHHLTAQQVSPGLELLGSRMEYRLNGYFPVGEDKSHKYGVRFDSFAGHRIFLHTKQRRVLVGGDAEIGAHLTQSLNYDAYLGAGPYYFSTFHASAWGGKVRLLARFKEYISLEASYSYDHLFGSIVQGTIAFYLPFGRKLKKRDQDCSSHANLALAHAAFSPHRFEIPVIKRVSRKEKAINPITGKPWTVWFVNNTSSSDGTFSSPFPTLVQAQNASAPNDIIYVFPGDGTTKGMDMGIALQNGQKFLGSGIAHTIPTTLGTLTIPAFSSTYPKITNLNSALNLGGTIIVPANGNEISGFNITVNLSGTTAIFNPAAIQGITIDHNNISGNVSHGGVNVTGSGKMVVAHNQLFTGVLVGQAIRFTSSNGAVLTGKASDNIMTNYTFGIGMNLTDNATVDFKISNNTILSSELGIFWGLTGGPNPAPISSTALISNNFITTTRGGDNGIIVAGVAPNAITKIIGNTIDNTSTTNATNGIAFSITEAINAGKVIISDNQILMSTPATNTSGILVESLSTVGAFISAEIDNNQIAIGPVGLPAWGINVRFGSTNMGTGTICIGLNNNQVTTQTPGATGINLVTSSTGIINIDEFSGNIAPDVNFSGNVNQVPSGTCDP
jgi:hypothetical protein